LVVLKGKLASYVGLVPLGGVKRKTDDDSATSANKARF